MHPELVEGRITNHVSRITRLTWQFCKGLDIGEF